MTPHSIVAFLLIAGSAWADVPAKSRETPKPTLPKAVPLKTVVPSVNDVVNLVQKHYDGIKSAHLTFEQTYTHPVLPEQKSKGEIFFKPNKMLWSYDHPPKKFYINGSSFTYYRPTDKMAYTHGCFEQDTMTASIAFMGGKGKLSNSFTVTKIADGTLNKTLTWLALAPKEKNAPAKSIWLGVNASGEVVESIVFDVTNGKNHFRFIKRETNKPLADNIFVFTKKQGESVEPMPNVVCPKKTEPTPKPVAPPPPKTTK